MIVIMINYSIQQTKLKLHSHYNHDIMWVYVYARMQICTQTYYTLSIAKSHTVTLVVYKTCGYNW